ncbi:MAG: protein kinase [Planctomycetota bacterium]
MDPYRDGGVEGGSPFEAGLPAGLDIGAGGRIPPGTVVLRARIGERFMQGGFGRVYEATHVSLPAVRLAAKTLLPPADGSWAARAGMLRAEAMVLSQFCHPNVVRVFDFAANSTGGILIVEWIDGGSLADRIAACRAANEQLPLDEVLRIFAGVAHGLDAVHRAQVFHRDIKPGNILIGSDGVARIADFGISLDVSAAASTPRHAAGTFRYMAPESLNGRAEAASDIYSLGLTLFEALTGQKAVPAPQVDNPVGWFQAHTQRDSLSPHDLRSDVPTALAALMHSMCDPEPARRPIGALEVAVRLDEILHGHDAQGRTRGTPLPIRRARRDARARVATIQSLPAALDYLETLLNYLVAVLAAPHTQSPTGAMRALLQPLSGPDRCQGLAISLARLIDWHQSEPQRCPAPARAAVQFALAETDWPSLPPHGDPPSDWLRRLVDGLRRRPTFLARVAHLAGALPTVPIADQPVTAIRLAANIVDGLDAAIAHGPELPVPWWYVLSGPADAGSGLAQRLTGEHPGDVERLALRPREADFLAAAGGRALCIRDGEALLPLEPFATFDDGDWYLLAGATPEWVEYRCTTTGHRLRWWDDPAKRHVTGACIDHARAIFPDGIQVEGVALVHCNEVDFRSDLQRLPDEFAPLLARAASAANSLPDASIACALQVTRLALSRALGQTITDPGTAIERERLALLPRVPAGVIGMAEVVRRASTGPARASSALLAMFAAVRIALWQAGALSMMLNLNMKTCARILGEYVGLPADDYSASTFRRQSSVVHAGPPRQLSSVTTTAVRGRPWRAWEQPEPSTRRIDRVSMVALDPTVLACGAPDGRVECSLPAEIGVSSSCTIALDPRLKHLSRRQVRLEACDTGLSVRHIAFGNRTCLNGCRLPHDRAVPIGRDDLLTLDVVTFVMR